MAARAFDVVISAGSPRPAVEMVTVVPLSLSPFKVSRAIAIDVRHTPAAGPEVESRYWLRRVAAIILGERILNVACGLTGTHRHHRLATRVIAALPPLSHGRYGQL